MIAIGLIALGAVLCSNLAARTKSPTFDEPVHLLSSWLIVNHGMANVDGGLTAKRPGAGQHFVEQNSGGKNVRARVDPITARLFRGGVGRRSIWNANFSQLSLMNA